MNNMFNFSLRLNLSFAIIDVLDASSKHIFITWTIIKSSAATFT